METIPVLAAINGATLFGALIWIVIAACLFYALNWAIAYIGVPDPFNKLAKVVIVLIVLFCLINGLMILAGRPLVHWSS